MAEKKRVNVQAKKPAKQRSSSGSAGAGESGQMWQASPEAKSKALRLRIVSLVLWTVAIALEIFTIVWALVGDKDFNTTRIWIIFALIVVIGVLAVVGSLLWKKANRLDPASESDKVRFFVQNQLGAIIAVIAFLPLFIFILADNNLSGKQKGALGGVVAAVFAVAFAVGIETDSPSVESYTEDTNIIALLHKNPDAAVYWTKSGEVYHVCDTVPAVNKDSKDGTIYDGTIQAAQEAGKARLTKQWKSEARTCGFSEEDIARVESGVAANPSALIPEDQLDEDPADTDDTVPSGVEEPAVATP